MSNGIHVLKAQGLIASGGTNPLDEGFGHIMLMSSSKSKSCDADEEGVEHYRQEIMRPIIVGTRRIKFPDLTSGAPIELQMEATSWLDRNFSQIKVLKDLENEKSD